MNCHATGRGGPLWVAVATAIALHGAINAASGQTPIDTTPRIEIYGFGQADLIADFKRNDPNWFDVNRPTKLPSGPDEFGRNGHTWLSARQSRFGVKGVQPTRRGDVTAVFDFDMFGVGVDAGQTTIRLRHAYGQWDHILAGQLESPFMDLDVFPYILDYWGPSGMIFFRNVLIEYRPIEHGQTRLEFALERPGASGDAGIYRERIELQSVTPRFPLPDFSASYRTGAGWGYFKFAGIVRDIRWDQTPVDTLDLSGRATGWGLSASSNLKLFGQDVIRLQAVYGEGIQNYFNDAPVDIGVENNFSDPRRPIKGKALPIFGAVAYLDHYWNPRVTSAIGWSMTNITNSDAELPRAFHQGQYATANLLWNPATNVMMGAEFQYGYRQNNSDGFQFSDYRLQFSFKYSFSQKIGGKP